MEIACQDLASNVACTSREPSFSLDSYETMEPLNEASVYHQVLRKCVAALIKMNGFEFVCEEVLQLLLYVVESFVAQLCRNSRLTTENAGRTETTAEDVFLNLNIIGRNHSECCEFLKRARLNQLLNVSGPKPTLRQPEPIISKIVGPLPHPAEYKGLKFLPPFPEPHTYHRTEVVKDVFSGVTQHEVIRRITSENKRSAENSLEHFALRTYPSISLFKDSNSDLFPFPPFYQVLLPVEEDRPYLSALVTENNLDENEQRDSIIRMLQKELEEDDDDEDML
uniref:Transcription initiation factor TFIID subunit 8 n=1 Tax=Ditylenchus dipsaci TaxID=166011 RepID=A0A915CZU0_9BILA